MAHVARYLLRGSRGAGDDWYDSVWVFMDLPEEVDLLCPDLGRINVEVGCMVGW